MMESFRPQFKTASSSFKVGEFIVSSRRHLISCAGIFPRFDIKVENKDDYDKDSLVV